jgi:hypothetical protein
VRRRGERAAEMVGIIRNDDGVEQGACSRLRGGAVPRVDRRAGHGGGPRGARLRRHRQAPPRGSHPCVAARRARDTKAGRAPGSGERVVETRRIPGSAGRHREVDANSMPLKASQEARWKRIDRAFHRREDPPPVRLYEAGGAPASWTVLTAYVSPASTMSRGSLAGAPVRWRDPRAVGLQGRRENGWRSASWEGSA